MKKRIRCTFLLLCAFIISGFVLQAFATGEVVSSKKIIPAKSKSEICKTTGRVTGCNVQKSTVDMFMDTGSFLTIVVDKNTVISKAGKTLKISDIKWNNSIAATYETKQGKNIAKSITIQEKPALPSSKKNR